MTWQIISAGIAGLLVGGVIGVGVMCLAFIAREEVEQSERPE